MVPKLDLEARMTIKKLHERGCTKASIARTLGVTEGSVRYHLDRQARGAADGRSRQEHLASAWREAITHWLESQGDPGPVNLAGLHSWLVEEHGYEGSLRSIQRYFRAHFPKPRRRARRRIETPPGAQAQVDWAHFPRVQVGGELLDLLALHMQLSHSRFDVVVWSTSKDQLAWLHTHNEALRRLEGVPATLRVDNEKTAVSRGAGAWGEINPCYRRYAQAARFHVDACAPRSPEAKGKVERSIRTQRLRSDPQRRAWDHLEELQTWSDEQMLASAHRRICPVTGGSVFDAWQQEKPHLAPLPVLPEPFDIAVTRRVGADCMLSFEGRSYSVPFWLADRRVEVRGCAGRVQVLAEAEIAAEHPRNTRERILIDPTHFEGEARDGVVPPTPLGRMGRRLAEIAALEPERRPLDLYAALAEVAR
jgi:transposase